MSYRKSNGLTRRHPYLNCDLWLDGTLQFWRTPLHNQESYEPFLERMRKERKNILAHGDAAKS